MSAAPGGPARDGIPTATPRAMVYVRDPGSEGIVRQALADLGVDGTSFSTGGVEAAIAALAQRESPRLLVVDISGTDDPVARVHDLAQLCEPTTGVVVIGDTNDVVLYRNLKHAGIVEYFFKPLVSSLVGTTFGYILNGSGSPAAPHTGKLVVIMGMRGGAGATSVATAAAWHLAEVSHRHVLLLDLDLTAGDMALQLDQVPNHTLSEALQQPQRVDDMFIDRGVLHVTAHLDLLASLEPLEPSSPFTEASLLLLLDNLLSRYRYVFIDLPAALAPQFPRLLQLPGVTILICDPSLVAARDVARWREKIGPNTASRSTVHILNKAGAYGSLPTEEFARAAGHTPDLMVPYEREIAAASLEGAKGLNKHGGLIRALGPALQNITGEAMPANPSLLSRIFG